jgi:hypothetical protein
MPTSEVDVRLGRPAPPERLSSQERELWEKLTHSHRPGWFVGAEELLESYASTMVYVQQIEAALRKTKPSTGEWHACTGSLSHWQPRWRRVTADASFEARQEPAHGRRLAGQQLSVPRARVSPRRSRFLTSAALAWAVPDLGAGKCGRWRLPERRCIIAIAADLFLTPSFL